MLLSLGRPESVGNVVVKLEGEARTALSAPGPDDLDDGHHRQYHHHRGAGVLTENHKLLYKVQQVFPDERAAGGGFGGLGFGPAPSTLNPGQHEFRFRFKLPLNNICYDPKAMSELVGIGAGPGYGNEVASASSSAAPPAAAGGGLGGAGGLGAPWFLGLGGFRTMDGTRQLFLQHVKATLPPSLTGFPRQAEVRYYIKVTVQRPGFFKENWRYQVGFKFLPIEPPRPPPTTQEAFARRPFLFRPPNPATSHKQQQQQQSSSSTSKRALFGLGSGGSRANQPSDPATQQQEQEQQQQLPPPSIEMAARVPHPCILTCNEPLPLRLLARRLSGAYAGTVRLVGLEVALVGHTHVRVQDLHHVETTRWVVVSAGNLAVELFPKGGAGPGGSSSGGANENHITNSHGHSNDKGGLVPPTGTDDLGESSAAAAAAAATVIDGQGKGGSKGGRQEEEEYEIPAERLWAHLPLPNTVAPSFRACNLARRYEIEVKLSLSWDGGVAGAGSGAGGGGGGGSGGGIWGWAKGDRDKPPPPQLIHLPLTLSRVEVYSGIRPPPQLLEGLPPRIPPRPPGYPLHHPHQEQHQHQHQQQPPYPGPAGAGHQRPQQQQQPPEPPYDDLPPSYDEAMAADITAPPVQARPAYSGVTAENDPSMLPGGGGGGGGGGAGEKS